MTLLTETRIKKKRKIKVRIKILLRILVLLTSGIIYENISRSLDSKKYPFVGKQIDVDGHSMHICADGTGDVTVVFGAGFQIPSGYVDFYPLYREISKFTRVAVYDKPGYGWSDTTTAPRDIDTMTKEIHEVLSKAGEKPPYIYVAHSIASLEAIRFAQLHPDEVGGIVLIDGSNPAMYTNIKKQSSFVYLRTSIFKGSISLANNIGLGRLLLHTIFPYDSTPLSTGRNEMSGASEQLKNLDESLFLKTFNNRNQKDEGKNKEKNAATVLSHGYLGDIPLRIITSEELTNYEESKENQLNLLKWSANSRQVVVDGAGHAVHWFNPEVINKEILELLKYTEGTYSN